ncbi:hypothetical protein [Rubinisphaera margarita]|uniref:hypothetical protein n=1 Tax=Rubinisphaera margarita TaxID=2909586 RepID=UPI001EE81082|nr:hypothetical protein [Rubinisphaera margarita]MCG6154861.1 hypothetical protein [Rubinisphaera margarita]
MLEWLHRKFRSQSPPQALRPEAPQPVVDKFLLRLHVVPDQGEDFDIKACERLLDVIRSKGARTINDVFRMNIAVTIEDFFDGNRCKHSIAANVEPPSPFDSAEAWAIHLKTIRARRDVHDVLIPISMIEPYEDNRLGSWPYADSIWVYSSLPLDKVATLLKPLRPDELRDASQKDPDGTIVPPVPAPPGITPYWVWWD